MKRKIILSLLTLFLFFAVGATFATVYIRNTTNALSMLIQLHQIEDLRQHLIISIQTVQSDLYTVNTPLGHQLDLISENVLNLSRSAQKCGNCHHAEEVAAQLQEVSDLIDDYQNSLSYYITASANSDLINRMKLDAAGIGNSLLIKTEEMSVRASRKLEATTRDAMGKIKRAWIILYATTGITLILGIGVAANLTKSVTRPINDLVHATRIIADGNLGYTIPETDKTEFGELASHFNKMSFALKQGYEKLETEITERRETEKALVQSEAFLNTIFDSIRDPFCIISSDYHIVRVNEAYAHMRKKRQEELLHSHCYRLLYGRNDLCEDCIVQKTFLSGDSCAKEKLISSDDESRTWLEIYTYPIVDRDGAITHVIEYTRDITERKLAEEALRVSEERYALAAQGANDGLWDWDLKTNTIHYSYRWKSMLGYREEELDGRPDEWFTRLHPDDREQVEAKIVAHLGGHSTHFESEYRILHKDGTYRWMLNRGLAVKRGERARRMAGSQTDITARKTAEQQLLYDAFHDALTGLPNRALFMDRLNHVLLAYERQSYPRYAVLFLDIDRFKVVNDSMGHTIGDRLLIAVAKRLAACLRPADTIARLGGDEFAILLENITTEIEAVDIALRIKEELAHPFEIEDHELFTSASIGIAMSDKAYTRPEHILRDADIAMYQAKAHGNGSYEIFDTGMHANIIDRLQLEADLHKAVEHREFVLHYQPIVDLSSHRLVGFEALIRWVHPERGLVFPLQFIPLAEETGLIFPIAEWTLWESCRQLRSWQSQFPADPPLQMSINISGKQFTRPDLIEILTEILSETGLPPESLALEITESMIMSNIDRAAETMEHLRKMGIHIHIDDFGTGYSSLNYLHRFPVSALKIDKTFIKNLNANGEQREIVNSIVSLAQSLNLDVIAEGVELNHQLLNIREMKCDYAQGWLFSRPMDPEQAGAWIDNFHRSGEPGAEPHTG